MDVKVGDVIWVGFQYNWNAGTAWNRRVVTRTTKTLLFVGGDKYKRRDLGGRLLMLDTKENRQLAKRGRVRLQEYKDRREIKGVKWEDVDIEEIRLFLRVLNTE